MALIVPKPAYADEISEDDIKAHVQSCMRTRRGLEVGRAEPRAC
jgi:hypothetical protein